MHSQLSEVPNHLCLRGVFFFLRVERAVRDHCIFCHRGGPGNLILDGDLLLQEVRLRQ